MSDEDWLDDLLLADDISKRAWKRKAIGTSAGEVPRHMPKLAQFTCKVPIDQWRIIRAHIRGRHISINMWMRHALAEKYLAEGGQRELIPDVIRGRRERR